VNRDEHLAFAELALLSGRQTTPIWCAIEHIRRAHAPEPLTKLGAINACQTVVGDHVKHSKHSPPDALDASARFFQRIDYLVEAVEWLLAEALRSRHTSETTLATVQELQTALDANTAATEAAATAIQSEIADLAAAIAALTPGEAVTQAQLDQLNTATGKLTDAVSALGADDAPAT
jgi:hypothetical protein